MDGLNWPTIPPCIWSFLISLFTYEQTVLNSEYLEIVQAARQIVNAGDNHKFFDDIIVRMDFTREVGLNKLVDLLSLANEWDNIKISIKNWLDIKRNIVIEN